MPSIPKIRCCSGGNIPVQSSQAKKKPTPPPLDTLVQAVIEARAHIFDTPYGIHVHIGDRASYRPGSVGIQINQVAVSGNGVFNANDHEIVIDGIRVPTDPERIRQVVTIIESTNA